MGQAFREQLLEVQQQFPQIIKEVRGKGLLNVVELNSKVLAPVSAYDICLKMKERGILAKPTHDTTIRLAPPLCVSLKELHEASRVMRDVFNIDLPKMQKIRPKIVSAPAPQKCDRHGRQFTERGHIFVQVHLAEHTKFVMSAKDEPDLNKQEVKVISGNGPFNTLSGSEAPDDRNSWETFKLLLSDGELCSKASENWKSTSEASDNVTLMVSVEDTGIGIPLPAQDRVFTPFMQADNSTSRTYGGTGIGLSISKCLIELMGGEINFIRRPHIGSTFTFTVVLKRCEKGSCNNLKRPLFEALPTTFKGMKTVIVDGRPVRAVVTKYHLHRLGTTVEVTSSLKMVLGVLGQNGFARHGVGRKPDMILVEKESWGSGLEIGFPKRLQDLKQNGVPKLPKIILLATLESDKAMAAGFVDNVIMKPLTVSMLALSLQQVLGLGNKRHQGKGMLNGPPFLHSLLLGKNILVVNDNKLNHVVAVGALKKYGARVECVESGKAALAMLELPHNFDACFMDIQMPEMDGLL